MRLGVSRDIGLTNCRLIYHFGCSIGARLSKLESDLQARHAWGTENHGVQTNRCAEVLVVRSWSRSSPIGAGTRSNRRWALLKLMAGKGTMAIPEIARRAEREVRAVHSDDARGDTGLLQRRPVTAKLKTLWLNWSYS
jgi:hypothetical protein